MTFKIGDKVQLKGGSPIMTVTGLGKGAGGKPTVSCTWFDSTDNEKSGTYPVDALEHYSEKGSEEGDDGGDFMTR
jgi:uncharacterized protein YodC (DUF2158 family)